MKESLFATIGFALAAGLLDEVGFSSLFFACACLAIMFAGVMSWLGLESSIVKKDV